MRELIRSIDAAETAYQAGEDQAVVDALNDPTIQVLKTGNDRRPGYSSAATMGRDLGQVGVVTFLSVMDGAIQMQRGLGTQTGTGTALLLEAFVNRFNTTPDGIDFANDDIRTTLTAMFGASGVPVEPYLALGYSLESNASREFDRDATLADVADARTQDAVDQLQIEYDAGFNDLISGAITDGDRAGLVIGLRDLADSMGA